MIKIPIEPYWANAAIWYVANTEGDLEEFHDWLKDQGVIGLPRTEYTPYVEFINPYQALIFRMKWYGSHN
jgi:hypothetical protein